MRIQALILAAVLPLAAAAQEAAPPLPQDPRAPRFQEVERGLFTGFEAGWLMLFKTPTANPAKFPYAGADGGAANGLIVGLTVGYDLTDRIALSALGLGSNSSASVSYGAFSLFGLGADLRVALFGARDANRVERLHVYLHARGAYVWSYPDGLFASHDVYLAAGPGVEYFTRLRHFSIGLAADVAYLPKGKTAGIALAPTVRYTF